MGFHAQCLFDSKHADCLEPARTRMDTAQHDTDTPRLPGRKSGSRRIAQIAKNPEGKTAEPTPQNRGDSNNPVRTRSAASPATRCRASVALPNEVLRVKKNIRTDRTRPRKKIVPHFHFRAPSSRLTTTARTPVDDDGRRWPWSYSLVLLGPFPAPFSS